MVLHIAHNILDKMNTARLCLFVNERNNGTTKCLYKVSLLTKWTSNINIIISNNILLYSLLNAIWLLVYVNSQIRLSSHYHFILKHENCELTFKIVFKQNYNYIYSSWLWTSGTRNVGRRSHTCLFHVICCFTSNPVLDLFDYISSFSSIINYSLLLNNGNW